jgi:DNA polymerase-3 subunit alpha
MQSMLRGMRPNKFEHIIAGVSLYRPGPMEFIPRYNARLHGQEEIPYKHEALIPILSETYGIITYQEQIMQIASNLFGYQLGEADLMRKAVSKKREKDLMQHKAIFKERGPENGVPVEIAEAIFDEIEYFANYGFNKCLSGSTEVIDTETGYITTLQNLEEERTHISGTLTCDTDTLLLQTGKITDVIFNGVKPVFRLTTDTGRAIDATANHPFYTLEGWCHLEDLAPGRRIAVPRYIPVEGKQEWWHSELATLAHLIAKGNDWSYTNPVTSQQVQPNPQGYTALKKRIPNYPTDLITELPCEIFGITNQQIAYFITELMNHNACVDVERQIISLRLYSERISRQIQHLLLRLGVISSLKTHEDKYSGTIEYSLTIVGEHNLVQFAKFNEQSLMNKIHYSSKEFYHDYGQILEHLRLNAKPELKANQKYIYWDRVVSIEYIGREDIYDLTIEGTHNFIANDILVHNSHATDYAVITVQSAFLKCHYTAEFMTALLTVHFDDNTKVAMFLEECRRLQIPVLPPHVNQSAIDFDIENTPDGQRGIRFGLGAIKNAGVGALEHIINERNAKGKFKSLVDFCHRVDLRQVGKRAVESLIKVGAFEGWGERDDLLLSLDRMMGFSGDYHKAQEVGQKSMFGEAMGFEEQLEIPKATEKQRFSRREQLGWEKELMGLYVSGRPVDRHLAKFRAMGNLNIIADMKNPELQPPQGTVKIAGEVVNVRKILTKNNEQMAVITIEDWHDTAGSIEVVFFPRSWVVVKDYVRRHKEEKARQDNDGKTPVIEIEVGDILVAIGKYDKQRETPQILGDKVDFEFEYVSSDEIAQAHQPYNSNREWMNNSYNDYSDEPPPHFPTNPYDEETGELLQPIVPPAVPPSPKDSVSMLETKFGSSNGNGSWANGQHVGNGNGHDDDTFADMLNQQGDSITRHIKVTIQRSAETDKDRRRLRRIYSAFSSYPGLDSFSMVIETPGKPITMVFPETKTGWCDALRRELEAILGEGHIHISVTS